MNAEDGRHRQKTTTLRDALGGFLPKTTLVGTSLKLNSFHSLLSDVFLESFGMHGM